MPFESSSIIFLPFESLSDSVAPSAISASYVTTPVNGVSISAEFSYKVTSAPRFASEKSTDFVTVAPSLLIVAVSVTVVGSAMLTFLAITPLSLSSTDKMSVFEDSHEIVLPSTAVGNAISVIKASSG